MQWLFSSYIKLFIITHEERSYSPLMHLVISLWMCNRADVFLSLLSNETLQMRMTVLVQLTPSVQNASSNQSEMPRRGFEWEKRFDLLKWIGSHSDALESERRREESFIGSLVCKTMWQKQHVAFCLATLILLEKY